MENYRIIMKDLIPIKGYFDYIDRNHDSLISHVNQEHEKKAAARAFALCFYHFGLAAVALVYAPMGLEKLLK